MDRAQKLNMLRAMELSAEELTELIGQLDGGMTVAQAAEKAIPYLQANRPDGTSQSWVPKIRLIAERLGDRPIGSVTKFDLEPIALEVRATAVGRRTKAGNKVRGTRDGKGAVGHYVSAARWFWGFAIANEWTWKNPAAQLKKLTPDDPYRWAFTPEQEADVINATRLHTDDPELWMLILRLAREAVPRRKAIISLTVGMIEEDAVWFHDKGDKVYRAPVSRALVSALRRHAESRGAASPDDRVFRHRDGRPITKKSFEHFNEVLHAQCAWVGDMAIGIHHVKTTTLRDVSRVFGENVARKYGHHAPSTRTTTQSYTKASEEEVRYAHSVFFEPEALDQDRMRRRHEVVSQLAPRGSISHSLVEEALVQGE